jgi:photosystem II stability/assembly factor-like uncharacterized protein
MLFLMKRLFIILVAVALSFTTHAQQWEDIVRHTKHFADIKKELELQNEKNNSSNRDEENEDYHIGRWLYYWESHLDEQGDLVSPAKTWNEWIKYSSKKGVGHKKTSTNQSQWTFQGPNSTQSGYHGLGRINTIAFHPTDSNTFIVGSAGGGAWRTTNAGLTWTDLYNDIPVLSVSDIDYNPLNPNTIYISTGDHDGVDNYSIGLLKSYDGGQTWDTTGIKFNTSDYMLIHKLLINPMDTNALLIATNYNLKKSFDGGNTWVNVANGNFKDIVYNPSDTNIIYAAANGFNNANIFRSTDGGMTWNVTQAFPNDGGRIALAVTPIDPAVVKAVVSRSNNSLNGIYSSVDAGASYSLIYGDTSDCSKNILNGSLTLDPTTCGGQAWYDLCIAINPTNANEILVGCVNTYRSLDGGSNWDMVTQWYDGSPGIMTVHADKHFIGFNPLMFHSLFEGNDGGIYKTNDAGGLLWNDLSNGMGTTQFYRNAVAGNAHFVLGGAQDNGSKILRSGFFSDELTGGDGMNCEIDNTDSTIFYTAVQYGSLHVTTDGGATFNTISDNIPGQPTGAWVTPYVLNPTISGMIIAGYDHVYYSLDYGQSWNDISPNFPTTGTKLQRIANTFLDDYELVTMGGNNVLNYTFNLGQAWTNLVCPFNGKISDIAIDPWNKQKFWFTFSGYGATKVASYIIGNGWSQQSDSLPNVPVNCIVIDSSNGTKYIGTDVAVFYRDTSMNAWRLYDNGLPSVIINDLGINYVTGEIWAATFGRGMWKSPKLITQPPVAINHIPYALDVVKTIPNPNKGSFDILTSNPFLTDKEVTINIIDYTGANVMSLSKKFSNDGKLNIDASQLSRGNYVVEVLRNGNVFAKDKIVVY